MLAMTNYGDAKSAIFVYNMKEKKTRPKVQKSS